MWPKSKARISTPPTDTSGSLANIVTVIQGTRTELNLERFQNFSLDKPNPDTQVNFSM
ncbi:MAG: hypothetical protein Q8M40_01175 [Legionella sp.]|nr:hypothetical protein [Legionella sp.]